MAKIKPGLGKGLDLLIPANEEVTEEAKDAVFLKINEVEPNRNQPRKQFNEEALTELSESIKLHGVIQPILVRKQEGYYEIIAGERRWRAARMAGLSEVPVIIREYTDKEVSEIALIENIQREGLNPVEEALAYRQLIDEYGITQEELSMRISKSRAAIANTMRLLKLSEEVLSMLSEGNISAGHARALLALENGEDQKAAADEIVKKNLSVRETESLVKNWNKTPVKTEKKPVKNDFVYRDLEKKMTENLGTKVKIANKNDGTGKIEISYYSDGELEKIFDMINKGAKER